MESLSGITDGIVVFLLLDLVFVLALASRGTKVTLLAFAAATHAWRVMRVVYAP